MFTVHAATDINGDKHNLELQFTHPPSLPELEAAISNTFNQQFPGGRFLLGRIQMHDEVLQKWVELSSAAQLREYAQIYAFNRNSAEVQKAIPPPVQPSKPQLPDNATHEEKARAVFDDLDTSNNRVIELDEFRKGYRTLHFDFTQATVDDLFQKADANGDGVISYAEWQRFTEVYPTMLDSLYFRCKDYWTNFQQQQGIRECEEALARLQDEEKRAAQEHEVAQDETRRQQEALQKAEEFLTAKVDEERAGKGRLVEKQREAEDGLRQRQQCQQALEVEREAERQRAAAVAEAQRDTDRADQNLAWQEAEEQKSRDKERQAQNVMEEAAREVDRAERVLQDAQKDLDATQKREQRALEEHQAERQQTEREADKLNRKDVELQGYVAQEREADLRAKEAAADTERERMRRDDEDRALQLAREREQQAHVQCLEAQRAVEELEKRVQEQEEARLAALDRRRVIEKQEKGLLIQEVRLREQRDALEEKEVKLRTDASSFLGIRGQQQAQLAASSSPYRPQAPAGSPYRGGPAY
eukprot:TRINITY_DN732_c0_g5_i1.p1 TRINITY_DN732_c0_g5~~TRINITY_DN732_c0_g5_i1.p1  ORF type:complete len:562 (+),score=275.56 TRINITY_DN732_c0_g5_i1:95-1687(+)